MRRREGRDVTPAFSSFQTCPCEGPPTSPNQCFISSGRLLPGLPVGDPAHFPPSQTCLASISFCFSFHKVSQSAGPAPIQQLWILDSPSQILLYSFSPKHQHRAHYPPEISVSPCPEMLFVDVYHSLYMVVEHSEGKKAFILVFRGLQGLWSVGPETGALPQAPAFTVRPLPAVLPCLPHAHVHPALLSSHSTSRRDSGGT